MHNNQSRNEILERIAAASNKRLAFVNTTNESAIDIYKPIELDAVSCFKNELESIQTNDIKTIGTTFKPTQ